MRESVCVQENCLQTDTTEESQEVLINLSGEGYAAREDSLSGETIYIYMYILGALVCVCIYIYIYIYIYSGAACWSPCGRRRRRRPAAETSLMKDSDWLACNKTFGPLITTLNPVTKQ